MTPAEIIAATTARFEQEKREALYRFRYEMAYQLRWGWREPALDQIIALSSARIEAVLTEIKP